MNTSQATQTRMTTALSLMAGLAASLAAHACLAAELIATVQTVEGERTGRLLTASLEHGLSMQTSGSDPVRVASPDVVSIAFAPPDAKHLARGMTLELAGADQLTGTIKGFENDRIQVDTPTFGAVAIPLERVTTILTPRSREDKWRSSVRKFRDEFRDEDAILLTNGDTARGLIVRIDSSAAHLETASGEAAIPLPRVLAIRLAGSTPPGQAGITARIIGKNGERLTVGAMSWSRDSDNAISARLAPDDTQPITLRPTQLARIDWIGGRWTRLSDLSPLRHEHTPMMTLKWDYHRNRNVLGNTMRVAGRSFDYGIGVHSRATLVYDLGGRYRQFVTAFGLDDDSGPHANVDIEIRIDGNTRHATKNVTPGTLHGPVRLDVTGASELELIVGFGENGSLQDRFNWANPALIR